jgi:F-type H+-transporting ATPase subunit c
MSLALLQEAATLDLGSIAAIGAGKIGGSAMEAMARQPEMHGKIQSSALILAAFVEAVALFAVVVSFLK